MGNCGSCGIRSKFLRMKLFCEGTTEGILHGEELIEQISINSGVRHGCILLPTLFIIVIYWIMGRTLQVKTGIHFTTFSQLEDLEYADNICLLLWKRQHMLKKTEKLVRESGNVVLRINPER